MVNDPLQKKGRFDWALSLLQPGRSDVILEVGCGVGILAEKLASALPNGKIVAIDKSAAMITTALKRTGMYHQKGVLQFHTQDYASVHLEDHLFDKAVAFNMSAFWQTPQKLLPLIKKHLKPTGRFYLFYQPPFNKTQALSSKAEAALRTQHFQIEQVVIEQFDPAPAFCIVSTPP